MRALVISDLHAITKKDPDRPLPSLIEFTNSSRSATRDPLLGLCEQLTSGKIPKPDVIICGGDLGNKADAHAIRSVWKDLNEMADQAGIKYVFATCGNHDLDTRHVENKFDPKGFLRSLHPPFPIPSAPHRDPIQLSYWADNFSLQEFSEFRILNINSCAYHGYGPKDTLELEHGRVSDFTIDNIRKSLEPMVEKSSEKYNICIFHHHLREISTDQYSDKSTMSGGENLIQLLSEARFGEWLIIHGHRHRGEIYQASGISSPIVLSCASFSATPVGDEHNPSPNQFYSVELDSATGERKRIKGEVQAWNWAPSYGWLPATDDPGGLPRVSGFGFKGDLVDVADRIYRFVTENGRLMWEDTNSNFPELKYFLPQDLRNLTQMLEINKGLSISYNGCAIREIVRL